jgi:hypothetical protein
MVRPMLVAATVSPEAIRRKAEEVVARPDYQLDSGLNEESLSLWLTLLSWVLRPIIWLFEAMDGMPLFLRILVIIVLGIALVALAVHIVWTLIAALRPGAVGRLGSTVTRQQPTDPRKLEDEAERAAAEGEHLDAIRLLFRAALLRIEQAEQRKLRIGMTNRELLRRYSASALGEPLQLFVETIDRKWYGKQSCEPSEYERCREGYTRISTLTQRRADALGA